MRERRHREDAPWPGSVATNCVSCYRRWPCEGFQAEEYIAALEAALALARAAASAAWGLHVDGPPGTPCYHVDVARIDDLRNALLATRAGAEASG